MMPSTALLGAPKYCSETSLPLLTHTAPMVTPPTARHATEPAWAPDKQPSAQEQDAQGAVASLPSPPLSPGYSLPALLAPPRPQRMLPVVAMLHQQQFLYPVDKQLAHPHELAMEVAGVTDLGPISTFACAEAPRFSGYLSHTVVSGKFSKIRLLRTFASELFVVRMQRLQPPAPRDREPKPYQNPALLCPSAQTAISPSWYMHELRAQHMVDSPFVPLAQYYDSKSRIWQVVPAFDGDLLNMCFALGGTAPWQLGVQAASVVLKDLVALAKHGWLHRDIKLENIFWRTDGTLALGDFGMACPADQTGNNQAGTRSYMAPELYIAGYKKPVKADVFSLGLTLADMVVPGELYRQFALAYSSYPGVIPKMPGIVRERAKALHAQACLAYYQAQVSGRGMALPAEATLAGVASIHRVHKYLLTQNKLFANLIVFGMLQPDPRTRLGVQDAQAALRQFFPEDDPAREKMPEVFARAAQEDQFVAQRQLQEQRLDLFAQAFEVIDETAQLRAAHALTQLAG